MQLPSICCVENVSYQRRLESLLANYRHGKAVSTALADYFCVGEGWIQLHLVVKRLYWKPQHYFKTRRRMGHNLLSGSKMLKYFQ